jgi:hypothetical protein
LRGLRGVFLGKRKEDGENYMRRTFTICISFKYDKGCQINKKKMSWNMQHAL